MEITSFDAAQARAIQQNVCAQKEFVQELHRRAVAEALAGHSRMFVKLDKAVDIGPGLDESIFARARGSSFVLNGHQLQAVLEALGPGMVLHARAVAEFANLGFRVEAESIKSRDADPLAFAPVLEGWRIIWEEESPNCSLCRMNISLRNARELHLLAQGAALVKSTIERILTEAHAAAHKEMCSVVVDVGSIPAELQVVIREDLEKRGFKLREMEDTHRHVSRDDTGRRTYMNSPLSVGWGD